ncbi:MAG: glycosyltransferase family 2 protein [Deltaproteobacteria bacterium]|nr:MAG: glycosyltransferase family 2 protein [Deltaproteobacteria bacterium]TMB55819.1 MAG: glycosyltransferase family 2 protein [Deltaproteobacteria bacterium]
MAPEARPLVSIVTVTFNAAEFIAPFCAAVAALRYTPLETIIVDNASRDGTAALVRRALPTATLVETGRNLGFAGGSNAGARRARGDILLFLNPDTRPPVDAVEALVDPVARDPGVGATGCKLVFPDGRIQCAGGIVGPNGLARQRGWGEVDHGQYDAPIDVDYVPAAALAVRRTLFWDIGGFHEGYFPGFYEDTELCLRVRRRGHRVVYLPAPRIVHLESQSMGRRLLYWLHANRHRFVVRNLDGLKLRDEVAWFYAEHLRPAGTALLGLHPRRFRMECSRLMGALAGEVAGLSLARAANKGRHG